LGPFFVPNTEVLLCQIQKKIYQYILFFYKNCIYLLVHINYKYNLSPAKVFAPSPSWTFALKQKAEYKKRLRVEKPQPIVIEEPIEFIPPEDHQFCQDCEQWLPNTDFYKRLKIRCKACELDLDRKERQEYLSEHGGSAKVLNNPNTYVDIYQKEQTFEFMKVMGYTFNEENGVWYKLPWKDKDGNFPNIEEYGRPSRKFTKRRPHTKRKRSEITQEEKDEVINLHLEGYSNKQIAKLTGQANGTVWRWVEKHKLK